MQAHSLILLVSFGAGITLIVFGLVRTLLGERSRSAARGSSAYAPVFSLLRAPGVLQATTLTAALVLLHFVLGFQTIEARGISHVEAYVPGLALIPGDISVPPPRFTLAETLRFHWHSEPHPPGYFVLMWFWTKAFGTSLTAIRLPSLLLGCISVAFAYLLAARSFRSVWAGVLAAGLVALNGHHLHYALMARPYELASALGLVSTWLWLRITPDEPRNLGYEILYVAATVLGLYVHVLFWAFLAAQMLYTLMARRPGEVFASRPLYFQTLATIMGSPMLYHALYAGRRVQSGGEPSLAFTQDFVNFGFLFQQDTYGGPDIPFLLEITVTAIATSCLVLFLRAPELRTTSSTESTHSASLPSLAGLAFIAAGFVFVLMGLNQAAWRAVEATRFTIGFPILALACYAALARIRVPGSFPERGWTAFVSPFPVLALVTFGLSMLISTFQPAAVSRALLLAAPPLLITLAGGLFVLLQKSRPAGALVLVFLVAAHWMSVDWYRNYAFDRDYRGLAEQVRADLHEGDRILVPKGDWRTTPIFYHLEGEHARVVGEAYESATDAADRVWVIRFNGDPPTPEMQAALVDFVRARSVTSRYSEAILFQRKRR